jgi:anti-sigma regulatory factor (Ser/Thr protein kinase)
LPVRNLGSIIGIEIIADDYGLDLSNKVLAVTQELSIAHRLGCGLSGIRQLMDELIVTSTTDQGTHLIARRWTTVSPTLLTTYQFLITVPTR